MNFTFSIIHLFILYLILNTLYKIYYNDNTNYGDVMMFVIFSFLISYTYPIIYIIMMTNIFYDPTKTYSEVFIFIVLSLVFSYTYPIVYILMMTNTRFNL